MDATATASVTSTASTSVLPDARLAVSSSGADGDQPMPRIARACQRNRNGPADARSGAGYECDSGLHAWVLRGIFGLGRRSLPESREPVTGSTGVKWSQTGSVTSPQGIRRCRGCESGRCFAAPCWCVASVASGYAAPGSDQSHVKSSPRRRFRRRSCSSAAAGWLDHQRRQALQPALLAAAANQSRQCRTS